MPRRASQAYRAEDRSPRPFWVWLLVGLFLGLTLATLAFYRGWVPELRGEGRPRPAARVEPPSSGNVGIQPESGTAVEQKPKFDFYTLLPEMETVIPSEEIRREVEKPPAATGVPSGASSQGPLFLQVASFRSSAEAEQMKARLALLGLRAQVVPVNVNGADWFRVRVGPFDDARALEAARATLEANGIKGMAIRSGG